MADDSLKGVLIAFIVGSFVLVSMALFSVSFIIYYRRRRRESLLERKAMQETYQRELLQSQLEIQNHTLQQISEELHDNIGQLLTVVVMQLNSLEDNIVEFSTQQSVQQTRDLVQTIITDVRTLSKTLDQDTVQRFGLLSSLTLEVERIQRIGRVHMQLTTLGEPYLLGEQIEIVLLRMAQESLNNAIKHGMAKNIVITTDYQPELFTLTITDNGRGFSVDEVNARTLAKAGSGLNNLHRRARLLGGSCTIASKPNEGTRVQIQLPSTPVREDKTMQSEK